MKSKLAFFECEGWEEEYIKENYPYLLKVFDVEFYNYSINDHKDLSTYSIISVFIYSRVDKEIINKLKNCKAIITRSMGYDHIDVKYAKEKGIKVYNIYDYGTNTVAEFTIMVMHMLLRKVKKIFYDYELREIIDPKAFRGEEISGKTIGIVGTGNIGIRVIELLQPYNVKILAYSRHEKDELKKKYKVKYVPFEKLLEESDIISFHVPLTPQTKHMLNKENINHIKDAYIINTSRGAIIETEALVKGLKNGNVKGIALDVFEGEHLERLEMDMLFNQNPQEIKNAFAHQILRHGDNVIITPHIAYDTQEALNRILKTTVNIALAINSNNDEIVEKYRVKES